MPRICACIIALCTSQQNLCQAGLEQATNLAQMPALGLGGKLVGLCNLLQNIVRSGKDIPRASVHTVFLSMYFTELEPERTDSSELIRCPTFLHGLAQLFKAQFVHPGETLYSTGWVHDVRPHCCVGTEAVRGTRTNPLAQFVFNPCMLSAWCSLCCH